MKTSKLIAKILMLCGISLTCTACYASVHADFELKGHVVDGDGYPVEGIEVSIYRKGSEYPLTRTGITDQSGDYTIVDGFWMDDGSFKVVAKDVDGDLNGGSFVTASVAIVIKESDFEGGKGSFYLGKVSKTADFILILQHNDENE